jgi:CheY-like chemotaxis protein
MNPPPALLVVEDDSNDVFFIRRGLAKAGVSEDVREARDGEEALAYLRGEGPYADRARFPLPSLILLDLKLPKRSGLEVLDWLRGGPDGLREIPVIVLTSSKQKCDMDRAAELGIVAYHIKPVGYQQFVSQVEAIGLYWRSLTPKPA